MTEFDGDGRDGQPAPVLPDFSPATPETAAAMLADLHHVAPGLYGWLMLRALRLPESTGPTRGQRQGAPDSFGGGAK